MSETVPIDRDAPPRTRSRSGPRIGLVAILVALALVVGIALMIYAMRDSGGWFGRPAAPVAAAPVAQAPVIAPQPAPPNVIAATDPATLAIRETNLAAQLASLEARAATLIADAQAAGTQAGRAESILVAFAARRAVDRGVGLGYLEAPLRQRFGASQPGATLAVIQAARQPVTVEALLQGFDAAAAVLTSGGGNWFSGFAQSLRNLVVLHEAGTPSPLPADRLARARRMLEAGQVEAALAEVSRLPGAQTAGDWTAAARRYVAARKALDTLEATAIAGPAPVTN